MSGSLRQQGLSGRAIPKRLHTQHLTLSLLAEEAGRKLDPNWGSLKVMQEVLVAKGRSETEAKAVVAPMQKVHSLRTDVKGHATTDKKRKAEIDARTEHGSFRSHFTQLAAECDKAFNEVLSAFGIVLES